MSLARSPAGTVHRANLAHNRTLCGRQLDGLWEVDVIAVRPTCGSCRYMHSALGSGFTDEQIDRAAAALANTYAGWTWSRDRWRKIAIVVAEQLAR